MKCRHNKALMITDALAGDRLPACRSFGPIHHLFTKPSFSEADQPNVYNLRAASPTYVFSDVYRPISIVTSLQIL